MVPRASLWLLGHYYMVSWVASVYYGIDMQLLG